MSEPRLSAATRELLRAAKADGPGAAARAKMWGNVAGSVGAAAGGAGAAGAAGAGGASLAPGAVAGGAVGAAKMLAVGTLLGGTITVGLAVALLRIGPSPSPLPPAALAGPRATVTAAATAVAAGASVVAPPVEDAPPPSAAVPLPLPPVRAQGTPAAPVRAGPAAAPDDGLAREAAFVAEARGALKRGDPASCLRAIRAARVVPSHQLGPEELALEAQAFRALGREDDARDSELQLRKQFPESALAR